MIIVGIDENGLGPRLGPLVATAAALRVESYKPQKLARAGARLRITDSKKVSAFGNMAHRESFALALACRQLGRAAESINDLFCAISLDATEELQAPCPKSEGRGQCWRASPALPLFGGSLQEGLALIDELEKRAHIRIEHVKST